MTTRLWRGGPAARAGGGARGVGGHGDEDAAGEGDAGEVGNVVGVGAEDLVAAVEGGVSGQEEALADAGGDEDLAGGVVADAVETLQVGGYGLAQLGDAVVGGV